MLIKEQKVLKRKCVTILIGKKYYSITEKMINNIDWEG